MMKQSEKAGKSYKRLDLAVQNYQLFLWSQNQIHIPTTKQKMNSFIAFTFLTACLFATAIAYDCPELAKDFYGNDIVCGYGLASDWKTCGKTICIFIFSRKDTLDPHEPVGWKTTCRKKAPFE